VPGPHIQAAGSAISITGGHGDTHGFKDELIPHMQSETICDGPAECRAAVRQAVKNGADVIKITATGGVLSNTNAGTGQQFFNDELEAIVEAATKMGRKVTAHAHGKDGIESALKAGVQSIEHGTYLDEDGKNAEEFTYMVAAGMSEMEAIESATTVAAKHIGLSDVIGTLETGKFADLIGVDGNPLDDIEELRDVDFVMKGGKVYKSP